MEDDRNAISKRRAFLKSGGAIAQASGGRKREYRQPRT